MKDHIVRALLAALAASLVSCTSNQKQTGPQGPDALASHIDTTVRPGTDFFHYANGKWFKENPIPASEQNNGLWRMIGDTINAQVRAICESSAGSTSAAKGSNKQKIGDFFSTGMDSVALNRKGISDLQNDLAMIDGIKDRNGIAVAASHLHAFAGSPMFGFGVGQDDKISNKNAVFVYQGGLSLPDRNFYFDADAQAATIRKKFVQHLENMFTILGYDAVRAKRAAGTVMKLETAIAKTSRKREDTRDPWKNYNKMPFRHFSETMPNFDWSLFVNGVGLKNLDTVIVGQPEFLTALNGYLATFPLGDWKDYLKYHLVSGLSAYMDDRAYHEAFSFYATTLRGVREPRPRWKRVVTQTNGSLGELIGQVYVDEYLPKGAKEKLQEIGNAIRHEFGERLKALPWMSPATKEKALKKLNAIVMKVGYPDKWKDLSTMVIDRGSYVHNVMNANKWAFDYMIAKYGRPVDRTEWTMEPQTYNAYYSDSNNEIVVPGCNIVVPGYERALADDAILYSIIGGSTFGHEITHGFDDNGCKYDDAGNLNNWWTPEDSARFSMRTKMIVQQFNGYIAVDSLHINGELTQGENIADLGGVIMGYEAFKKTNQYKSHEVVAGLTPDQRYFLGFALGWMVNDRPEAIATQVRSNEHSPVQFRVNGPLSNMPEFHAAFGLNKGDAMWRPDSMIVRIW